MNDLSQTRPEADTAPETKNLAALRRLVTVLTATMIGGVLLIIALLVIRLNQTPPLLPERLVLPDGVQATAFTQSEDWYAVVTADNQILIYDRLTGRLTQKIELE